MTKTKTFGLLISGLMFVISLRRRAPLWYNYQKTNTVLSIAYVFNKVY